LARILILDDEPDACSLLKRVAEGMKHDTAVFTLERDAIEYGRDNRIDLAILDLKLRHVSGLEVFKVLRKSNPGLKGLILTGYPTEESAKTALKIGATEYLVKPIDIDLLEERIEDALALNEQDYGPL
jgi:DNA-binding NtrC family response regulator